MSKSYIGDGVYTYWDGINLWLESGGITHNDNRIAINEDNIVNLMAALGEVWDVKPTTEG